MGIYWRVTGMVPCLGIGLRMIGMPSCRTPDANYKWDGLHQYALHTLVTLIMSMFLSD